APLLPLHSFPPRRSSDLSAASSAFFAVGSGLGSVEFDVLVTPALKRGLKPVGFEVVVSSGSGSVDLFSDVSSMASFSTFFGSFRSEEHTSELQSREKLLC